MKLFTKTNPVAEATKENDIIAEIHKSFYEEVDNLLAEAKILKSTETQKQDLIDKSNRLKALGFTNTKEVKEAEKEIQRIDELKMENEAKERLVRAINYFSFHYPQYKFITEESVKKICKKYNLVYGKVDNYIGEIPLENLNHIEKFSIKEDDICYVVNENTYFGWGIPDNNKINYISSNGALKKYRVIPYHDNTGYITTNVYKSKLEIVAPLTYFNLDNKETKDFQLVKKIHKDPIVLHPVFFEGQKHYLIVTAWGKESSDELVINEKNN